MDWVRRLNTLRAEVKVGTTSIREELRNTKEGLQGDIRELRQEMYDGFDKLNEHCLKAAEAMREGFREVNQRVLKSLVGRRESNSRRRSFMRTIFPPLLSVHSFCSVEALDKGVVRFTAITNLPG